MNQLTFSCPPVMSIYDGKTSPIFVFQNPDKTIVRDALLKLESGEYVARDCTNKAMDVDDAKTYLNALLNDITNLFYDTMGGRVLWNIVNKDLFVAQVRTDVLCTDFTKFTSTTEDSVFAKLAPIESLLNMGMYSTSVDKINLIPIDEFITPTRKQLWVAMLTSANAVI